MCCINERVNKHDPDPSSAEELHSMKGIRQAMLSNEVRMVNVIKNRGFLCVVN